jgi:hypothetical protein
MLFQIIHACVVLTQGSASRAANEKTLVISIVSRFAEPTTFTSMEPRQRHHGPVLSPPFKPASCIIDLKLRNVSLQ